jgi:hypothetical protein
MGERGMIVDVSTTLACSLDEAIAHVRTPRLLQFVASPLVRFVPVEPSEFPDVWGEGRYTVALRLFGVIPFGEQAIVISMPPTDTGFCVRDAGHGALISTWDHLITITPQGTGCHYRDRVHVRAGVLTPVVWLFAQWFYRHRQRRWRVLCASGFDYAAR